MFLFYHSHNHSFYFHIRVYRKIPRVLFLYSQAFKRVQHNLVMTTIQLPTTYVKSSVRQQEKNTLCPDPNWLWWVWMDDLKLAKPEIIELRVRRLPERHWRWRVIASRALWCGNKTASDVCLADIFIANVNNVPREGP